MIEKKISAEQLTTDKIQLNPPPLSPQEIQTYMSLIPNWQLINNNRSLELTLSKNNYLSIIQAVTQIAQLSHRLKHHPDIHFSYSLITITSTTHSLNQHLSINDFVLAHHINQHAIIT